MVHKNQIQSMPKSTLKHARPNLKICRYHLEACKINFEAQIGQIEAYRNQLLIGFGLNLVISATQHTQTT